MPDIPHCNNLVTRWLLITKIDKNIQIASSDLLPIKYGELQNVKTISFCSMLKLMMTADIPKVGMMTEIGKVRWTKISWSSRMVSVV